VASAAPPALGGVIVDNNYFSVGYTVYTGPNGPQGPLPTKYASTVALSGGTYSMITDTQPVGGPAQQTTQSGTYTTNGSTITIQPECPNAVKANYSYTVKGGTLIVYVPSSNGQMQEIVFNSIGGL
jgi:hypothetical protein